MFERVLRLTGPVHVIAGLLVFVSAFVPPAQEALQALLQPPPALGWTPMLVAIFGPTVASWGLLFDLSVREFLRAPTEPVWRRLLFAVLLWFSLDTGLCLYIGFYWGALLNAVVAVLVVSALLAVRRRTSAT